MGTKRHKPEDVIANLRQADVLIPQGHCKLGGIILRCPWVSSDVGDNTQPR
ncbi:hypothetical protein OFEAOIEE_LOCUS4714 [Methylorubrum extorquens]